MHNQRGFPVHSWQAIARATTQTLLLTWLAASGWRPAIAADAPIIPLPQSIFAGSGELKLGDHCAIRFNGARLDTRSAALYLAAELKRTRGWTLPLRARGDQPCTIAFSQQPGLAAEGYRLEINRDGALITASTGAGLFYGAVTLWQLLPPGHGDAIVPSQHIADQPVYPWRGLMLDSARHFQSAAFIHSMIDWMAWHKLNILHWHLTDDQGWRLQILKYPRLTSIGAWRTPASVGDAKPGPYGGFYTQREVREIVAYAASRHILVVPEIDMPGHAQAAIAAYPNLGSLTGPAPPVSASWGVHTYLYNLEPATFSFLEDVLGEVMQLFPSPYIHLGGDEAVKDQWRASASVQARARELGVEDPDALQAYFTQRMGKFLAAHGRRLVGWDEILTPDLPEAAVVMAWHGTSGAHAAAIAGHDAVLTPWPAFYFDNRQSSLDEEPPGRTRVISLEDVYRFDPRDASLSEAQQPHILGVQGNIWTEHIRTEERVEWMSLPRAAAIAELGWTAAERRDWDGFLTRLAGSMARYRVLGIDAADSAFGIDAQLKASLSGGELRLSNQSHFGEIHYTLDGQVPGAASAVYTTPLRVGLGTTVRATTFSGSTPISRTWTQEVSERSLHRRDSHALELCSDAVGLLLEPQPAGADHSIAVDIMNPCWWYRGVELTHGARLRAAVVPLPFNYQLGAELKKVRFGDTQSPHGELEVHIDSCSAQAALLMPLGAELAAQELAEVSLPALQGTHDLCLRMSRPALDPLWALDWMQIAE